MHSDSAIPLIEPVRKSKYGRKPLLPELRRSYQFKVGFCQAEFDKIQAKAEQVGIAEADLIRRLALGQEVKTVSQLNRTAYSELAKLASNLNQIARAANTSGNLESAELIRLTYESVQSLRSELLGA